MKLFFVIVLVCALLWPCQTPVGAMAVVTYNENGTLVDGTNILKNGTDFLIPSGEEGNIYYILNETGQEVNIVPGASTMSLGSLPAGNSAVLAPDAQITLIDSGQDHCDIREKSGTITDGGDYYQSTPPAGSSGGGSGCFLQTCGF